MLNPNNGVYEQRKNADLNRLYNAPNIQKFLRSKMLKWTGHIWRAEVRFKH